MPQAKREEGKKVNSNINVTPMVDVMLVLLIIFMVITPMLQKGVSVDMAKVNSPTPMPDADKEDALLIAVMRDGKTYLGSDQIKVDDLTNKVKDRLANKVEAFDVEMDNSSSELIDYFLKRRSVRRNG